ncbi:MAG TPA: DNA polymerase IV [Candidatus Limnocylindrales bacterium]|nr:DNA polymerase IV [Candidatus Limnocylindrales bacterium]
MAEVRKIIHIDMDAFYASVEQRDNPNLRGRPIAVGYEGKRGVVATASYEARKSGVHSAMASSTAKRLCSDLVFIAPRFEIYRAVSKEMQSIFAEYTDLIEPLSLDEAYLDVTKNKKNIPSAWTVAQNVRDRIYERTGLTASAGVSYNKFLAKTASDLRKPNGQYLITPEMSQAFIADLPIQKFHGIGPATSEKMRKLGIHKGADLKAWPLENLQQQFGKLGAWYYHVARGNDYRLVQPFRERKSVSAETTFPEDVIDRDQVVRTLSELAHDVWNWVEKNKCYGRTIFIKIKWDDFGQSSRSHTEQSAYTEIEDFRDTAIVLLDSLFPLTKGVRLVGVGISGFGERRVKTSNQSQLEL